MDIDDKNLNESSLENSEANEEIEFDDNIDIDALQAKLQAHMASENVEYQTEPAQVVVTDNSGNEISPSISEFTEMLAVPENNQEVLEVQPKEPEISTQPAIVQTKTQLPQEKVKLQPGEKKFVIYIEPENLDFIESLSIKDRKKVINKVLQYEDNEVRKQKEQAERAKFTNQVIIMVLTVVISLPIFFLLLNKSIEMTILNYQQAQQNFVKLYKEQGKIKSYKKFQKTFD